MAISIFADNIGGHGRQVPRSREGILYKAQDGICIMKSFLLGSATGSACGKASQAAVQTRWSMLSLASLALLLLTLSQPSQAATSHDRSFWLALRAKAFEVPRSEPVLPLALEATGMLGSTDPQVRDAIAYEALATWIYSARRLENSDLNRVVDVLGTNARRGLGEKQGDGLFLRSFSTLGLAAVAAEDIREPFLSASRFDALINLATEELAQERDLRGYIVGKGWGHATAHCADLLKFLSRSPRLKTVQQARIVDSIAARLRSAGQVFVWGEDARLAAALAALTGRPDFDPTPFNTWIARLTEEHQAVWRGPFDPMQYIRVRVQLNTITALAADLDVKSQSANLEIFRARLHTLLTATQ